MSTRRDFLEQSTLATSALFIADPLLSFACLNPEQEKELFDVIIVGGVCWIVCRFNLGTLSAQGFCSG